MTVLKIQEEDYNSLLEKINRYEKALNECIRQDGLMDFLDKNSWACQEDYFVEIGKNALYK